MKRFFRWLSATWLIVFTPKPLDLSRVVDVELDGVDFGDYPDFCDAYISRAYYEKDDGTFRELTDDEYDEVNEDYDFVYSHIQGEIETAADRAYDTLRYP